MCGVSWMDAMLWSLITRQLYSHSKCVQYMCTHGRGHNIVLYRAGILSWVSTFYGSPTMAISWPTFFRQCTACLYKWVFLSVVICPSQLALFEGSEQGRRLRFSMLTLLTNIRSTRVFWKDLWWKTTFNGRQPMMKDNLGGSFEGTRYSSARLWVCFPPLLCNGPLL